jgi:hypothetical protein
MVNKRLLQRMQAASRFQPLYGFDFCAIGLERQHTAALDRPPIEKHRTGAAIGIVAPALCSGQAQIVPQQLQ